MPSQKTYEAKEIISFTANADWKMFFVCYIFFTAVVGIILLGTGVKFPFLVAGITGIIFFVSAYYCFCPDMRVDYKDILEVKLIEKLLKKSEVHFVLQKGDKHYVLIMPELENPVQDYEKIKNYLKSKVKNISYSNEISEKE